MDWVQLIPLIISAASAYKNSQRSAGSEIPGILELMGQTVSGRRDAQIYARAATNPQSAWWKGLQGALEEKFINQAFMAMRQKDIQDMRKIGRGIPISYVTNPERRDEARYASWNNALQKARLASTQLTPQVLLNAARASSGSATLPPEILRIFSAYGDTRAQGQQDLLSGAGGIFGQLFSGGGQGVSGTGAADFGDYSYADL